MRIVLKLIALLLFAFMKIVCLLGNLITNISSYVIGLLLLVIAGCSIYCVCTANWKSLAILVTMGVAVFAVVFVCVWFSMKADNIQKQLGSFIWS